MDAMKQTIGKFGIDFAVTNHQQFLSMLGKSKDEWKSFGKEMVNQAKNTAANMILYPKFEAAIMGAATALTAAGLSMKALAVSATLLYSRTAVLNTVLITVGRNAGYASSQIIGIRNEVSKLGITTQDASQAVIKLAQNEVKLSEATALARSAQDLAVISGESSSEAYSTLIDSIGSLSPMLLRQYGLTKTLTDIEEMYARKINKSAQALTEVEIKQAMVNYILLEGKKASGNYAASMEDAGKQVASFSRLTQEIYNEIGKQGMVIYQPIINSIYQILKGITELPEPIKQVASSFIVFGGSILSVAGSGALLTLTLASWGRQAAMVLGLIKQYGPVIVDLINHIGKVIGASEILEPIITQLTLALTGMGTSATVDGAALTKLSAAEQIASTSSKWLAEIITLDTEATTGNIAAKEADVAATTSEAAAATADAVAITADAGAKAVDTVATNALAKSQAELEVVMSAAIKTTWTKFLGFLTETASGMWAFISVVGKGMATFAIANPLLVGFAAALALVAAGFMYVNKMEQENKKNAEVLKGELEKLKAVNDIKREYLNSVMAITKAQKTGNAVMDERIQKFRELGITVDQLDAAYKALLASEGAAAESLSKITQLRLQASEEAKKALAWEMKINPKRSAASQKEFKDIETKIRLDYLIYKNQKELGVSTIAEFDAEEKRREKTLKQATKAKEVALSGRDASRAVEQEMIRLGESVELANAGFEFGVTVMNDVVKAQERLTEASGKTKNANVMDTAKYIADVQALDSVKKKSIEYDIEQETLRFNYQKEMGQKGLKEEIALKRKQYADRIAKQEEYQKTAGERTKHLEDQIIKSDARVVAAKKRNKDENTVESAYLLKTEENNLARLKDWREKYVKGQIYSAKELKVMREGMNAMDRQYELEQLNRDRALLDSQRQLNLVSVEDYQKRINKIAEIEGKNYAGDPAKKLELSIEKERIIREKRDKDIERNSGALNRFIESAEKGSFDKRLMNQAKFTAGQKLNLNAYFRHYQDVIQKEYEMTDGARRRELNQDIKYGSEMEENNQRLAKTYVITNLGAIAKNDLAYKAYSYNRIMIEKKMYDFEFEKGKEQIRIDNDRIEKESAALKAKLTQLTGNLAERTRQYSEFTEKVKNLDKEADNNKKKLEEMEDLRRQKQQNDRLSFEDKMTKVIYEKTHTAAEVAKKELFEEVMKYVTQGGGKLKDTYDYVNLMLQEINKSAAEATKTMTDGFDNAADSLGKVNDEGKDTNKWYKTISDFSSTGSMSSMPASTPMGPGTGDVIKGGFGFGAENVPKVGWGTGSLPSAGAGMPGGPPKADTAQSFFQDYKTTAGAQLDVLKKIADNTGKAAPAAVTTAKADPNVLSGNASVYAQRARDYGLQVSPDPSNK